MVKEFFAKVDGKVSEKVFMLATLVFFNHFYIFALSFYV